MTTSEPDRFATESVFPKLGVVALVHDGDVAEYADAAANDVFAQMDAIEAVIRERGGMAVRYPVNLNLWEFKRWVTGMKPGLVFNLVESLDRSDRLQSLVPMVLEDWRIPFTGTGSMGMILSNNKIESKSWLAENNLPVAECRWVDERGRLHRFPAGKGAGSGSGEADWIIKAVEAHASAFMNDASVLRNAGDAALADCLAYMNQAHGQMFFAERFIEGREFNISIIEGSDDGKNNAGPLILPPAEIRFDDLEPGKPSIVGYAAKWDEESHEYVATPRSFDFPPSDRPLLDLLGDLTVRVWEAMHLRGYARVDYRVAAAGNPFILEANANPCLTPTAGLAAAAAKNGTAFADLVERIARAAL